MSFRSSVGSKLLSRDRGQKRATISGGFNDFRSRKDIRDNLAASEITGNPYAGNDLINYADGDKNNKQENLNVFRIPLSQDALKREKNRNAEGNANRQQDKNERSDSFYSTKGKDNRGFSRLSGSGETKQQKQSMTERFKE